MQRGRHASAWSSVVPSGDEQFALKRQALLKEAARAFSSNGYHSTSLLDVAKVLGVTKTALYYYVESKQQIDPDPRPDKPTEETKVEPEPVPEKPPEKVEVKPDNAPQPDLEVLPPPKPVEKPKEKKEKPKHRTASLAAAPSSAEHRADRAAAPSAGANSNNPNAVPNWKSQLVSQLERHKRYPSEAQSRGEAGVVHVDAERDHLGAPARPRREPRRALDRHVAGAWREED